jgi:hypothetical protein
MSLPISLSDHLGSQRKEVPDLLDTGAHDDRISTRSGFTGAS